MKGLDMMHLVGLEPRADAAAGGAVRMGRDVVFFHGPPAAAAGHAVGAGSDQAANSAGGAMEVAEDTEWKRKNGMASVVTADLRLRPRSLASGRCF